MADRPRESCGTPDRPTTLFPSAPVSPGADAPPAPPTPLTTRSEPADATGRAAPGFTLLPVADPVQVRNAVDWLRWGVCRGLASEALLFAALAGTASRPGGMCTDTLPASRTEIYNCLRLTHDLPWSRRGLDALAAAHPPWRALRGAWEALAATMAAEIGPSWPEVDRAAHGGFWPRTPNTLDLLRRTLAGAGIAI